MRTNKQTNKQKLGIKLKYLLMLVAIPLLFYNCETDDLQEEQNIDIEEVTPEISVTIIDLSEVATNTKVLETVEKLSKVNSISKTTNRDTITSNEYGFSLNTDYVKLIEVGDYHSYTFQIIRDEDNGLFENLVISLNNEGNYDLSIVSYDLTENELANLLFGNEVDLTNKITQTSINDENIVSSLFSRDAVICITVVTTWCEEGNHSGGYLDGAACPAFNSSTDLVCTGGGGGGPSGPSSGDPTSDPNSGGDAGEGGSSSNTNNAGVNEVDPYYTAPTCSDCPELVDTPDPCSQLKNNSRSADFRAKMNDLNTKSTTLDKEAGYVQKPDSAGTGSDYDYVEGDANTGFIEWDIPHTTTLKGLSHTHYDTENHLPVFSADDLYALFSLFGPVFDASGNVTFNNPHNIGNDFTYILITAHGTKLALKFNDATSIEKFRLFGEKYFGDWNIATPPTILGITPDTDRKKLLDIYNEYVKDRFSIEKQKKMYAKFLDKNDLGVSLYQANDDFTEWEKINKSGAPTPCN